MEPCCLLGQSWKKNDVANHLLKQAVSVFSRPTPSLPPMPPPVLDVVAWFPERPPPQLLFISRLTSMSGSTVLVMVAHRSHLTSLCNCPEKVECTIQLQDTLVDPREVEWIWFKAEMKNSWASCWAWPDSSVEAFQVVARKSTGPYGMASSAYIWWSGKWARVIINEQGTNFFKQLVHFAAGAGINFALPSIVLIAEEVVTNQWIVDEGLQNNVHETSLAKIEQSSPSWQ